MPIDPSELESPNVDTTPTIELPEITKIRFSDAAKELENARVQQYIEANFALGALEIVKQVLSMIPMI